MSKGLLFITSFLNTLIQFSCNGALLVPLPMVHQQIAQETAKLEQWPDAGNFASRLVFETDGQGRRRVRPPAFTDGQGPVGVFAMLDRNDEAQFVVDAADDAFKKFCSEVMNNILDSPKERQDFDDTCVLAAPKGSHHITVAIFQEHPILLQNAEERENWKSIDKDILEKFELKLSKGFGHDPALSLIPDLTLDALILTPDGALIACFLDSTDNFLRLRSISKEVATEVLEGSLTSRPKTLIHATVGRVLGLPEGSTSNQRERLTQLAFHYNEQVLPNLVMSMRERGQVSLTVREVSLLRNTVWLMYDRTIYASWKLS